MTAVQNNCDLVTSKPLLHDNYQLIKILGEGAFGKTLKAHDVMNSRTVALKCIKNIEDSSYDDVFGEIEILSRLNGSGYKEKEYIVKLYTYFIDNQRPYLVFEYLPYTLDKVLDKRSLAFEEVTAVGFSLLKALLFLSHASPISKIVHGDLKPGNIMFDASGKLKIIDFGLSYYENSQKYHFAQSLYYRAPEVFLFQLFGTEIDMWSVACILFECYTGRRLFEGDDDLDQLMLITELLGMPPLHIIEASSRKSLFFQQEADGSYDFLPHENIYTGPASKSLYSTLDRDDDVFNYSDHFIVDFLAQILTFHPELRLKPEEAILLPMFIYDHFREPRIKIEDM